MHYKREILLGLFVTALLVANTVASKLIAIGGIAITVGVIAYPLTFAITDIVGECWGKLHARRFVTIGFLTSICMMVLYALALALPSPAFWEGQQAFESVLGAVPRFVLASMVAYLLSQSWDVWMFHLLKSIFNNRHLWLRNNISTFTSQFIDSAVFVLLAFFGTLPAAVLFKMLVGYVIVKWVIAICDTPLVYLGVRWVNKDEDEPMGAHISLK